MNEPRSRAPGYRSFCKEWIVCGSIPQRNTRAQQSCGVWTRLRIKELRTDYEEFGQWLERKLEGSFVAGKPVSGKLAYPGFEHLVRAVDMKKMENERLFSFAWQPYAVDAAAGYSKETPTLVGFTPEATDSGTQLAATESEFENIPANRRLEAFRTDEEGWGKQMEGITNYVG